MICTKKFLKIHLSILKKYVIKKIKKHEVFIAAVLLMLLIILLNALVSMVL